MKEANIWIVFSALAALQGEECCRGSELDIDPNEEASAKRAFRDYIVPDVHRWSNRQQNRLKTSLAYFKDKEHELDNTVLGSLQDFSMPDPEDIPLFFHWLWEVLYPGENASDIDFSDVVENNDVMQINEERTE